MKLAQLTIYGAGLIGGSLALAARKSGFAERIVAIDREAPKSPELSTIFDEWATKDEHISQALAQSSLTVLCVPALTIVDILPHVLQLSAGFVTDCGSTKARICQAVEKHPKRGQFVAGHPMAGHPEGGLANARADLFENRRWILCPQASTQEALNCVEEMIVCCGARSVELDAEKHDASVASTSHLPQVVASALSVHAAQRGALEAAGPGFASATRVAGGAEAMWTDIFATNGPAIGSALKAIAAHLEQLGQELEQGEVRGSIELLEQARALREFEQK